MLERQPPLSWISRQCRNESKPMLVGACSTAKCVTPPLRRLSRQDCKDWKDALADWNGLCACGHNKGGHNKGDKQEMQAVRNHRKSEYENGMVVLPSYWTFTPCLRADRRRGPISNFAARSGRRDVPVYSFDLLPMSCHAQPLLKLYPMHFLSRLPWIALNFFETKALDSYRTMRSRRDTNCHGKVW